MVNLGTLKPMAPLIQIISVGKAKRGFDYLKTGEADYTKRLKPYATVQLLEVADCPPSPTVPEKKALEIEAERLAPYLNTAGCVVALAIEGKQWTSEQLAQQLTHWVDCAANPPNRGRMGGRPAPIIMVIGSAYGLAPSVVAQASAAWSLSPLTFPHPLVKVLILEQIYRAYKILSNEPYHKA